MGDTASAYDGKIKKMDNFTPDSAVHCQPTAECSHPLAVCMRLMTVPGGEQPTLGGNMTNRKRMTSKSLGLFSHPHFPHI